MTKVTRRPQELSKRMVSKRISIRTDAYPPRTPCEQWTVTIASLTQILIFIPGMPRPMIWYRIDAKKVPKPNCLSTFREIFIIHLLALAFVYKIPKFFPLHINASHRTSRQDLVLLHQRTKNTRYAIEPTVISTICTREDHAHGPALDIILEQNRCCNQSLLPIGDSCSYKASLMTSDDPKKIGSIPALVHNESYGQENTTRCWPGLPLLDPNRTPIQFSALFLIDGQCVRASGN